MADFENKIPINRIQIPAGIGFETIYATLIICWLKRKAKLDGKLSEYLHYRRILR
jgi:hypothetical protein